MNIHEYQAKEILKRFGVKVPNGFIVFGVDEIPAKIKNLANGTLVVKAQIHAGGRGKAGGVKLTKDVNEVVPLAKEMFGKTLVTKQTGPDGQEVRRVYIEEASNIKKEYYLSAIVDREKSSITFIASSEGGMEIEEVAETTPEKIKKATIDAASGMLGFHGRKLGFGIGLNKDQVKHFSKIISQIYQAFISTDASQIEINPLIENDKGEFMALDAKMNFDDNGLYRQSEIVKMRDTDEENPMEIEASKYGLSYIKMEGDIGCMVNGAGLAMSTMDIIKHYGGDPANFLDVGGGATLETVTAAFKIILSDKKVTAILVNIFGGIMRCDIIAEGVVQAIKDIGITVPLVVRLSGTNFELGKEILNNSGLSIVTVNDLDEAAKKVVELNNKGA